jgi:drug/metabolite transporter (DMT)-like permease
MSEIAAGAHALHRRGLLFASLAGVIWSSGAAIARGVETDAWTTIFWRSVFAFLFLGLYVAVRNQGRIVSVFIAMGWPGVGMALSFATASSSFVIALNHTSVAHVLFLTGVAPFIAALLSRVLFREPLKRRTLIATAGACLGLVIMVSGGTGEGTLYGDMFALLMATGFAVGTVIMRRYHQVRMTPAAGLAALFAGLFALFQGVDYAPGAQDMALLVLFGIGQLGIGLVFFTAGARLIPAAEAALCSLLELALGPLWVWLISAEAPDDFALVGGALIIAALIVNSLFDRNAAPSVPPAA